MFARSGSRYAGHSPWSDHVHQAPHLKPLTSFRFFAAASIMMMHSAAYAGWAGFFRVPSLTFGVTFFFVLSGFILTHVYIRRQISFGRFMWLRVAKLWPTHLATFALVLVLVRPDGQQPPGSGWFDPYLAMVANLTLVHSLIPFQIYVFSWNSVSWSISTEMGFYLLFPLLLLGLRRTWHLKLAACVGLIMIYGAVIAAFAVPATSGLTGINQLFLTYSSPLFRLLEFVVGMSAYVLSRRWRTTLVSPSMQTAAEAAVLFLVAAWFAFGQQLISDFLVRQAPEIFRLWLSIGGPCVVFAVAIGIFSKGGGAVGRLLSLSPFVWLGHISYSLYMVHQVLMRFFYFARADGRMEEAGPLLMIGACIASAALLHHAVERPMQSLLTGRWRPWRPKAKPVATTPATS
jgi:peptidoglycan/LPS O-acetylase OafA/YrhL